MTEPPETVRPMTPEERDAINGPMGPSDPRWRAPLMGDPPSLEPRDPARRGPDATSEAFDSAWEEAKDAAAAEASAAAMAAEFQAEQVAQIKRKRVQERRHADLHLAAINRERRTLSDALLNAESTRRYRRAVRRRGIELDAEEGRIRRWAQGDALQAVEWEQTYGGDPRPLRSE